MPEPVPAVVVLADNWFLSVSLCRMVPLKGITKSPPTFVSAAKDLPSMEEPKEEKKVGYPDWWSCPFCKAEVKNSNVCTNCGRDPYATQ